VAHGNEDTFREMLRIQRYVWLHLRVIECQRWMCAGVEWVLAAEWVRNGCGMGADVEYGE